MFIIYVICIWLYHFYVIHLQFLDTLFFFYLLYSTYFMNWFLDWRYIASEWAIFHCIHSQEGISFAVRCNPCWRRWKSGAVLKSWSPRTTCVLAPNFHLDGRAGRLPNCLTILQCYTIQRVCRCAVKPLILAAFNFSDSVYYIILAPLFFDIFVWKIKGTQKLVLLYFIDYTLSMEKQFVTQTICSPPKQFALITKIPRLFWSPVLNLHPEHYHVTAWNSYVYDGYVTVHICCVLLSLKLLWSCIDSLQVSFKFGDFNDSVFNRRPSLHCYTVYC